MSWNTSSQMTMERRLHNGNFSLCWKFNCLLLRVHKLVFFLLQKFKPNSFSISFWSCPQLKTKNPWICCFNFLQWWVNKSYDSCLQWDMKQDFMPKMQINCVYLSCFVPLSVLDPKLFGWYQLIFLLRRELFWMTDVRFFPWLNESHEINTMFAVPEITFLVCSVTVIQE